MVTTPNLNLNKYLPVIAVIVVLFIVLGSVIYLTVYKNSATGTGAELADVVAKVGRLMELPPGETPTLATISDPAQLASQPFFTLAQMGDKVLIYTQAKKAILYRPSTNKIVNVGPLNIASPSPVAEEGITQGEEEVAPEDQPSRKTVKLALYNGTTTSGLTNRFASDLAREVTNVQFSIVAKQNAANSNYEKTQIIDLTGNNSDVVRTLATTFNGVSSKLSEDEVAPDDAEVLVILGVEYAEGNNPTTAPNDAPVE